MSSKYVNFCALAYTGQIFTPSKGPVEPCCRVRRKPEHKDMPFEEYIKYLQEGLKQSRIPECQVCWQHEDKGMVSMRQSQNHILNFREVEKILEDESDFTTGVRSLEVLISNVCNLACQMCSTDLSTKWQSNVHHKGLFNEAVFDGLYYRKGIDKYEWEDKWLKDLRILKFLGGEPFYAKEGVNIINKLSDLKILQHIQFKTPTNCTVFPHQGVIDKILKFKEVEVNCSFDGYGPLNEYIRVHSEWWPVYNNYKKWLDLSLIHEHVSVHIGCTVTILNVNKLVELYELFKQDLQDDYIFIEPTSWPNHLSINFLSPDDVLPLLEDLKEVNNRVYTIIKERLGTSELSSIDKARLKYHFVNIEKLTGTKFEDINPDMARIVKKYM